jgi:preprotein translocase subunit SecG
MGGQSAFGTKAGDLFTRITMYSAAVWIILCAFATKCLNDHESRLAVPGQAPPAGRAERIAAPPPAEPPANSKLPDAKLPDPQPADTKSTDTKTTDTPAGESKATPPAVGETKPAAGETKPAAAEASADSKAAEKKS